MSTAGKSAATQKTDKPKRKAPRTAWKPGQSGNPAGTPKRVLNWQKRVAEIGNMKSKEVKKLSKRVAAALRDLPDEVTLRDAAVLAAYSDVINNSTAGMLNALADREEGKPAQAITGEDGTPLAVRFIERYTESEK